MTIKLEAFGHLGNWVFTSISREVSVSDNGHVSQKELVLAADACVRDVQQKMFRHKTEMKETKR